jgi:hypothetical protein
MDSNSLQTIIQKIRIICYKMDWHGWIYQKEKRTDIGYPVSMILETAKIQFNMPHHFAGCKKLLGT